MLSRIGGREFVRRSILGSPCQCQSAGARAPVSERPCPSVGVLAPMSERRCPSAHCIFDQLLVTLSLLRTLVKCQVMADVFAKDLSRFDDGDGFVFAKNLSRFGDGLCLVKDLAD
ncbi:unnamed protein product [Cochlearia groenlandica]